MQTTNSWIVQYNEESFKTLESNAKKLSIKKNRIGFEKKLFDYDGREKGKLYGSTVPILGGFILPIILITLVAVIISIIGFSAKLGAMPLEEMMDILREIQDQSISQNAVDLKDIYKIYPYIALAYLVIYIVSILFVNIFLKQIEKRSFSSLGFVAKFKIRKLMIGMLVAIIINAIPFLISMIIFGEGTSLRFNHEIISRQWIVSTVLGFLFFVVQASFEEIVFRGWSFTTLGKTNNRYWAIFLSSICFGMMHFSFSASSLLSVINATILGVVFCYLTLFSGDIFLACGFHIMWNFIQITLFGGLSEKGGLFSNQVIEVMESNQNAYVLILLLSTSIITILLAIAYNHKIKKNKKLRI